MPWTLHPCYDSKLCKGDADRTEEERRTHKQKHILRVCNRAGLTGLNLYLVRQLQTGPVNSKTSSWHNMS